MPAAWCVAVLALPPLWRLTVALGIGANTAIYSVFYAAWSQIFLIQTPNNCGGVVQDEREQERVSAGGLLGLEARKHSFSDLGVVRGAVFNLSIGEKPQHIDGDYMTPGFLDELIGDRPFMGRYFGRRRASGGKDFTSHHHPHAMARNFASDFPNYRQAKST